MSVATELKCFALIALTLTVLSGVYPLQIRGVNGAKDAGTGSDKTIPNLCTYLYCCPSFSKTSNLSNDTIEQDNLRAVAVGSNIYILWKEPAVNSGSGPIFLVKSIDNGHTFGSKKELDGDTYESNIAAYGNNVYVVFSSSSGVFFIKSIDGGDSFGSPVKLNQLNGIHPNKYSNFDIGAFGNNVYLVWTEFSGQYDDVFFIKSIDEGDSFSDKKNLSNNIGGSFYPKIEIVGNNVYVVWQDSWQGKYEVIFKRSIDGGNSFGKWINLSNNPTASLDPDIGSFGNNVYVIWDDSDQIVLRKSVDGGHIFGSKKIISSSSQAYGPLVDVSPDNRVYLIWRQEQFNPYGLYIIFERSINEGISFSCLTKLNKASTSSIFDVQLISTDARVSVLWRDYVNVGEPGMNKETYFKATPP